MRNLMWVRLIGIAGIVWNLAGVFSYLAHVGLVGAASGPPTSTLMPAAINAAFAIGVFGGVAGSLGLSLLAKWARPVLWLSWAGTVIDWIWVLGWSSEASVPLGAAVLAIATLLAIVGEWAAKRSPASA